MRVRVHVFLSGLHLHDSLRRATGWYQPRLEAKWAQTAGRNLRNVSFRQSGSMTVAVALFLFPVRLFDSSKYLEIVELTPWHSMESTSTM